MAQTRARYRTELAVVVAWATVAAAASPLAAEPPATTQPGAHDAPASFWPTDAMIETLLRRWSGAAAEVYALSPGQHQQLEAQLLDRWPKFLRENRSEWQPLLNEYLEARIAGQPPSSEMMRAWAHGGLPQLDKLRRFVEEGNDQFAALLDTRQQALFATDRSRLTRELEVFQTRLQTWERGEFRVQEWQDLTRPAPTGRGTPATSSQPTTEPQPADEFEAEMAAWDEHVRDFIVRYELDEGQRKTAESILGEMQARARDHYHYHRVRIAAMEELIRYPKLQTTEAEIRSELVQLYGPIDDMFAELERRLALIPTEAQKRQAREAPPDARQPSAGVGAGGDG